MRCGGGRRLMFNRKPKNRRLNRVHVLDVKLRSDQVRRSRMRLGALVFGTLFGTVFGAYILWRAGEWLVNRLVYENPAFAIRVVEVENNGVISADQLRRWANVKVGENLMALDMERVKRPRARANDRHRVPRTHPAAHAAHPGDRARGGGAGDRPPP